MSLFGKLCSGVGINNVLKKSASVSLQSQILCLLIVYRSELLSEPMLAFRSAFMITRSYAFSGLHSVSFRRTPFAPYRKSPLPTIVPYYWNILYSWLEFRNFLSEFLIIEGVLSPHPLDDGPNLLRRIFFPFCGQHNLSSLT